MCIMHTFGILIDDKSTNTLNITVLRFFYKSYLKCYNNIKIFYKYITLVKLQNFKEIKHLRNSLKTHCKKTL